MFKKTGGFLIIQILLVTKRLLLISLCLFTGTVSAGVLEKIQDKAWIHGSENCADNVESSIDRLKVDQNTYILRQNKCTHFEAPFIYLLFGQEKLLVLDTGATAEPAKFPLYSVVLELAQTYQQVHGIKTLEILVTHSHSHSDHYAGDSQFANKKGITLVEPNSKSVRTFFNFNQWPQGESILELGGRELIVLPIPGHQKDSIAIYDSQTQLVLTGDSFYPGRLYIRNWSEYRNSIKKLVNFSKRYSVLGYAGTHIEMANNGVDYSMGSKYQPGEVGLLLKPAELAKLDNILSLLGQKKTRVSTPKFIVYPLKQ
ncbi:MAG: MBL fold metallo-hydrolase [Kangiellaceae bacterium]|nr:MBL fold metallo-hydrolase [Kangiellaceae bacterium]